MTGAERRRCVDESVVSEADENKAVDAVKQSGSIYLENYPGAGDSSSSENQPITTTSPISPGSPSMRHSASDSLVYRADVDMSSSSCEQVLADSLHTDQVTVVSSVGLNGYCSATVDETCVSSQVGSVLKIATFI